MPDLTALEVLVAVARTGSLTTAAKELGRTQQAVSARVTALEALTGVTVLARTPAARPSRPRASSWPSGRHACWTRRPRSTPAIAALRTDRDTRLRVAASLTVAERLLPGWLVALPRPTGRGGGRPSP